MSSADQFATAPGTPSFGGGSSRNSSENPMSDKPADGTRRNLLIASCAAGGVAGVATLAPFIDSMTPSDRARAAGAPVEADISGMQVGELRTFEWRGKPVWIFKRSPEQIAALKNHDNELADPASKRPQSEFPAMPAVLQNEYRSLKPEYMVVVGVCTHLGCSPTARFAPGAQPSLPDDWPGGFLCPCHGSTFDLACRVFKNKPAPDNLPVPPYNFVSDTKIMIGEESKA
jgi:ubiquinol-cytochrome c reductase iron-sulfur subunit